MRRRDFIKLVGGATAAWPLVAPVQQPARPPVIGLIGPNSETLDRPRIAAFVKRLGELGAAL
jgi:hypothetical protein